MSTEVPPALTHDEQQYIASLERNWPPAEAVARREQYGYDKDTCLLFGEWMLQSARKVYGRNQALTRRLIELASAHDMGPSTKPIKDRFGGAIWRFNEELGVIGARSVGKYEDWTEDDFVEYGHTVIMQNALDKPDPNSFNQAWRAGQGPSLAIIRKHFGEVGAYFEAIGYVSPKLWTRNDYLEWGATLLSSGLGIALTANDLKKLARMRQAPSDGAVVRNYGSLLEFQRDAGKYAARFSDDKKEAASHKYGVYIFDVSYDDPGAKKGTMHRAFSTTLRCLVEDGAITSLSHESTILLDILLKNTDLPVYYQDFREQYRGKHPSVAFNNAFNELRSVAFLSQHLLRFEAGKESFIGLSSNSRDHSLIKERVLSVLDQRFSYFEFQDDEQGADESTENIEKDGHRAIKVIGAVGSAVAATASYLVIRKHHKR